MWLDRFIPLEQRRKRLLKIIPDGHLHQFLKTPVPDRNQDVRNCHFISIDLETSGFDPKHDHILSIGFVELHDQCVDMSTARHWVIHSDQQLKESNVAIHQLTDDVVSAGMSLRNAMQQLLPILAGHILLAHNASIETGFLNQACLRIYGYPLLIPVVDTLKLAHQTLSRHQNAIPQGKLRLAALREHYHLPRYKSHNALTDAIATGELFLAQLAERTSNNTQALQIRRILSRF